MEIKYKTNYISLLCRINHKILLFDNILSFINKRVYIFIFFIENDIMLKKKIKNTMKNFKINNILSGTINDNIYKFISLNLLYKAPLEFALDLIYHININDNLIDYFNNMTLSSDIFIKYYLNISVEIKELDKLYKNKNIKFDIEQKLPKGKMLISYFKDCLFFENEYKKLYNKLFKYLEETEHKENIFDLTLDENFLNKINEDLNNFKKKYFDKLIKELVTITCNVGEIDFKFNLFEKIDFKDEYLTNNLSIFKLRYHLKQIFNYYKIVQFDYEDFFNIDNLNKLKSYDEILYMNLENNSPCQKAFYNFFEELINYSYYRNLVIIDNIGQKNFDYEFYSKIDKNKKKQIGKIGQIYFEDYNSLYTENKDININEEKDQDTEYFDKNFFDLLIEMNTDLYLAFYEGYDINNHLVYFCSKGYEKNQIFYSQPEMISEDELEVIIKGKKNIYKFVMDKEKIELIYNRDNKHLTIVNINKKNEDLNLWYFHKDNKRQIQLIGEFIKNMNELNELTIEGFDYNFNDIKNSNITSLNINLNFNEKHFFDRGYCYDDNCVNLNDFKNLENLNISGDYYLLNQIGNYVLNEDNPKIKRINYYLFKSFNKAFSSKEIHKKLKKKVKLKVFTINNIYKISKKKHYNNKYINKNENDYYIDLLENEKNVINEINEVDYYANEKEEKEVI